MGGLEKTKLGPGINLSGQDGSKRRPGRPTKSNKKWTSNLSTSWTPFWSDFGSNLAPKILPKWIQVRFKIDLNWSVVLVASFGRILDTFLMVLRPMLREANYQKHTKTGMFLAFLWFSQDACYLDERIHLASILNGFGVRKSTKNRWKIDPKCDQKLDASWDGFGGPLGSIFDGFWRPSWGQVGAKLALKSVQDR